MLGSVYGFNPTLIRHGVFCFLSENGFPPFLKMGAPYSASLVYSDSLM
jgi:hypothetical protein